MYCLGMKDVFEALLFYGRSLVEIERMYFMYCLGMKDVFEDAGANVFEFFFVDVKRYGVATEA